MEGEVAEKEKSQGFDKRKKEVSKGIKDASERGKEKGEKEKDGR